MSSDVKVAQVAIAWRALLEALGYDIANAHLKDSPERVARFMCSWHTRDEQTPPHCTSFESQAYDEIVLVDNLAFHSMCAHHGLPFFGTGAIAYIPTKGRVVGLSKLARVLDHFAHRFQTQESIANDVAAFLESELQAKGVGVVLSAEHLCMSMRGVQKPGHRTTTSDLRGVFRSDPAARAELMALVRR